MDAGAVRDAATLLLRTCIDTIEERGRQYGNASLEEPGMITGRNADDLLMAMVEVKLNRLRNNWRKGCTLKRDTVVDLINYLAFLQGRQDASA